MGRLLSLVLGLAVVAYVAYWAVTHVAGADRPDPEGRSQPKAVLDRTRETARQIEQDAERRAQETLKRTEDGR
jgi:hypothetical protein